MATATANNIDQYAINIAKGLIMDTVRNANSGHTGGPLSSLDFTYTLFKDFLCIKNRVCVPPCPQGISPSPK